MLDAGDGGGGMSGLKADELVDDVIVLAPPVTSLLAVGSVLPLCELDDVDLGCSGLESVREVRILKRQVLVSAHASSIS